MSANEAVPQTQYYHQENFQVKGGTLPNAVTAYRTHGEPSNPCIVFPTCYGGRLDSQYYFVGAGKVLDTNKYFVVTFALFSNGESSSPSNTPAPHNGPYFPEVSYEDNIRAQHAVITEGLGISKVFCVVGFSMGGQQSYHWAYMYPDVVERFVSICSSARTSPHNQCFLEGPKAALVASRDYQFGHYLKNPEAGLRAFGRAYCAWAYGQTWFRQHLYRSNGKYRSLEAFIRAEWESGFLDWDGNDLLTLLHTWSSGDISQINHKGDFEGAMKSIQVKGLIMPCKTDLYFPPEDSEIEVSLCPSLKLVLIDSVWGHVAGGGADPADLKFMEKEITEFLNQDSV